MTRRYPDYKNSGVEWLGEVPEGWALVCLKHACHVFPSNVDKHTVEGEIPVLLCNYTDVYYNEVITPDLDFMTATAKPEEIEKFTLQVGDVVFTKDSETSDDIGIAALIAQELPGVVCGYHLSIARPYPNVHGPFIKRFFDSNSAKAYFQVSANGLTRVGLGQYAIDNLPLALPPFPEQTAIAAFLDRETAKIDALIAEQRRLIDLLREKRQAAISNAVTKGLNHHAPLKPSGIDWLGDVPKGWEVKRLRFLCGIETGNSNTEDADEDAEFPFFVRSQTVERIGHFTHDCEAVMTSGDGAGVGKIFHHYKGKFSAHQRVYIFTDFEGVSAEFFFHYLRANFFKVALEGGAKSTVDSLRRPLIANFWMTVPPSDEQEKILTYIAVLERQYALLSAETEAAIATLQERRAALISAAVTGKIDVRENMTDEVAA
jgi:type I restriction enzyme S subunit